MTGKLFSRGNPLPLAVFVIAWTIGLILIGMPYVLGSSSTFSYLAQSSEAHVSALDDMQGFRINGEESSNDWLVQAGSQISITGFVDRGRRKTYYDDEYRQYMMFVPEKVGGITIYHLVPFFETSFTTHELSDEIPTGKNLDGLTIEDTVPIRSSKDYRLTSFHFGIHDGWFLANSSLEYSNLYYKYADGIEFLNHSIIPDIKTMRRDVERASAGDVFWLDVSEGEIIELSGTTAGGDYVHEGTRQAGDHPAYLPKEAHTKVYVKVPAKLGTAAIYHVVPVYFFEQDDTQSFGRNDITEPGWNITIPVTVSDGLLVFARCLSVANGKQ